MGHIFRSDDVEVGLQIELLLNIPGTSMLGSSSIQSTSNCDTKQQELEGALQQNKLGRFKNARLVPETTYAQRLSVFHEACVGEEHLLLLSACHDGHPSRHPAS
jgi:hypothetical protein